MLMIIAKKTSRHQGKAAFQSGIAEPGSAEAASTTTAGQVGGTFLRQARSRKSTAIVTSPEKTPTRPIAETGRRLTKTIADIPSESPAATAVKNPFFTPSIPSAIQSIPSAIPVDMTGRNSAILIPSALASRLKTAAGRVMGTARSENEVRGSYPMQGRAIAERGENPSASMMGGSMVTGVAPIETRNEPKPTFRIMICS